MPEHKGRASLNPEFDADYQIFAIEDTHFVDSGQAGYHWISPSASAANVVPAARAGVSGRLLYDAAGARPDPRPRST